MPEFAKERADLAKADRDILEGRMRIAHQMMLIEELRRDGHDTGDAERLLWTLQQSLDVWHAHRDVLRVVVEKTMQRLRRGGIGSQGRL